MQELNRPVFAQSDVTYRLDSTDRITEVNEEWKAFATANNGAALLPPGILGRSLWDFIGDRTTILLYRLLFQRVRSGIGPVRFAFRCDAPTMRRLLEMSIAMQPEGALGFAVRPLRIEERPAPRLLDPAEQRWDAVLRMCGWCKRIQDSHGEWMEIEAAVSQRWLFEKPALPALSHGICEDCLRAVTEALDDPVRAASGSIILGALPWAE